MKKKMLVILAAAMITASSASYSALELDVPETAENGVYTAEIAETSTISIPTYDAKYGDLVYYNDFETAYDTASYLKSGLTVKIGGDTQATYALADNPSGTGKSLKITATAGASAFNLDFTGYSTADTVLTVFADYYLPSSNTKANIWWRVNGDGGQQNWELANDKTNVWFTDTWTLSSKITDLNKVELRNNVASGESYYIDNVRVYAKAPLAKNEIVIVDGDKYEKIDKNTLENGEYIFPSAEENSGEWFIYVCETDHFFQGEGIGDLEWEFYGGETYTLVRSTAPQMDEKLGQLIMFHGFEQDSHTDIEFVDKTGLAGAGITWSSGNGLGFNNYKVVDAYGSNGHALEMTLKDGAGYDISGFQYNFTNGIRTPGKYSVVMDVYNRNEGTSLEKITFGITDNGDVGTYEDSAKWSGKTFAANTWTRKVAAEQWTIAENTDEATKEQYEYKIGFDMTQGHTQVKANQLNALQYRFQGKGKTSVSVDNICMYFYPANAFMYTDGEDLYWLYGDEDGTYTFECYDYQFYTDGNNIYSNGDKVAIENLAGKVVEKRAIYDYQDDISVKFTGSVCAGGTSENTGFIVKATFSKKMTTAAEELGFVASKRDGYIFSTHIPEEGKDVIVAVYKKGSSDSKYTLDDDGTAEATGFVTGFDITSREQLKAHIDFRAYAKLKKADGGAVWVYSTNTKNGFSQSMCSAILETKYTAELSEPNDKVTQEMIDDAKAAYSAANYDGGNYFDDIINICR